MAGRRNWLTIRFYRLMAWLHSLCCKWRGQHVISATDWGYEGGGTVDCYCQNCGGLVAKVPFDDFVGTTGALKVIEHVRGGLGDAPGD